MFVYILHFDTPLAHAQHYVGLTNNLRQRLNAHASGNGSNLTKELFNLDKPWQLAALFQTTNANARRVEKNIKDTNNAANFCGICNAEPYTPKAAKSYPLADIPFSTRSTEIVPPENGEIRLRIRLAVNELDDLFAAEIQRKHKVELGFMNFSALQQARSNNHTLILELNELPVAFLIYTNFISRSTVTIHQCAVLDHARNFGCGRALVNAVEYLHPTCSKWCKVRKDLPANYFWEAIGFKKHKTIIHKSSKQELNQYFKEAIR